MTGLWVSFALVLFSEQSLSTYGNVFPEWSQNMLYYVEYLSLVDDRQWTIYKENVTREKAEIIAENLQVAGFQTQIHPMPLER